MPQPTPYTRSFSYTNFSATFPNTPQPGVSIDTDFDAIATTLTGVLANLARIQRDDGRLVNQSVTLDALSPAVLVALGAGVIWTPRGAWVTGTAYAVTDVIASGTASYVCAIAHTSAALLATDIAAGRWIKLFDDAGTIPADASVTPAKLAAGAVTTPAIGFTALDLSGRIRAAAGLQAGTAPAGSLFHIRLDTGDVIGKVQRLTDNQGVVALQIIGETVTWQIGQPVSANELQILRGATVVATFTDNAGMDVAGAIRATSGVVPTTGVGAFLSYVGTAGAVTAYDYDTAAWLDLDIKGKTVDLVASGVTVLQASATGVNIVGTAKRNGVELGWLDIPANAQNGTYTLLAADRGKRIYSKNVAGQTINIPTAATANAPQPDSAIMIRNRGTNPISVVPAGGVTLLLAGSAATGTRTVAANGMATLIHEETNVWVISGPGVS